MGKSMRGPDETDVIGMMTALSALHSGHVEVKLCLGGLGFSPFVMVNCLMLFDVLPGSSLPNQVAVEGSWPCSEHHELWAHIYGELHRLDYAISKAYNQEELWKE